MREGGGGGLRDLQRLASLRFDNFTMYLNANISTRKTRPYHTIFRKRLVFHAEEDETNVFLLENVVSAFEV